MDKKVLIILNEENRSEQLNFICPLKKKCCKKYKKNGVYCKKCPKS